MKVFRELVIKGQPEEVSAFRRDLLASENPGWSIKEEEQSSGFRYIVALPDASVSLEELGRVFLTERNGVLRITNIVPTEFGSLTIDQYNAIVLAFNDTVIQPLKCQHEVFVHLSNDEIRLEEIISVESAKKLRRFSVSANKSTGAGHPSDAESWHEFVVSIFIHKDKISTYLLKKWLIEEGWPEEQAQNLAIQFEDEIGALQVYQQRIGA